MDNLNNLITPQASHERRHTTTENVKNFLNSKKEQTTKNKVLTEAVAENKAKTVYRDAAASVQRNSAVKNEFKEQEEVFHTNVREALGSLFGTMVCESIPLDEDIKKDLSANIITQSRNVFTSLYESGVITISQSPTFKEYTGSIVKHVDGHTTKLSGDEIEDILLTIFPEHRVDLANTIKNVYGKNVKAIKDEKDIKTYRDGVHADDGIMTNSVYVREEMTPTLFRSINEAKIEDLTESADLGKLSREKIMDISLAETLTFYTILETLHTTKLIKFEEDKVKELAKYY